MCIYICIYTYVRTYVHTYVYVCVFIVQYVVQGAEVAKEWVLNSSWLVSRSSHRRQTSQVDLKDAQKFARMGKDGTCREHRGVQPCVQGAGNHCKVEACLTCRALQGAICLWLPLSAVLPTLQPHWAPCCSSEKPKRASALGGPSF